MPGNQERQQVSTKERTLDGPEPDHSNPKAYHVRDGGGCPCRELTASWGMRALHKQRSVTGLNTKPTTITTAGYYKGKEVSKKINLQGSAIIK